MFLPSSQDIYIRVTYIVRCVFQKTLIFRVDLLVTWYLHIGCLDIGMVISWFCRNQFIISLASSKTITRLESRFLNFGFWYPVKWQIPISKKTEMLSIPLWEPKIWTLEHRTLNRLSILSLGFKVVGIELF